MKAPALKESIEEVSKALDEYARIFKRDDARAQRAVQTFEAIAVLVTGLVSAVPDAPDDAAEVTHDDL